MHIELFYILLPIVALLYAAVGHGGASGYLALMALFSFSPEEMRPTALLLNLFVAGIAFIHFYRIGVFKFKLFTAFAVTSIPFAFLGGMLDLYSEVYKIALGIFLLLAVGKMLGLYDAFLNRTDYDHSSRKVLLLPASFTGAVIGLISGLIGIGGGIILSPVIILLKWGNAKEAAAVSALFIWVNSLAGLLGQQFNGAQFYPNWWMMVILVIVGGFVGGYIGARTLNTKNLRYLLSFVLLLAAIKLIFTI